MFGEEYFEARARLAELAERVMELADKTGADKGPLADGDVAEGMSSPYLFIACGESGVGKSTVLDAIFGEQLCTRPESGSSGKIRWFRHDDQSQDKSITPELDESYRPVEFLKRFNLMDTPGTDVSGEISQSVTQRFLPSCDLVLWVISVENPWGASMWDFFSSQSEATLKKSVIVLQAKDMRDAAELEIIDGHIRDLARQRLSVVPPMISVSAKTALEAKLGEQVDEAGWYQSGYPELERFVADSVTSSPARKRMLSDIRKAMTDVLRNIEMAVEQRSDQLEGNENFLRNLETEVEREQARQTADFDEKFADMRVVFAGKNKEVKRHVRSKLGFWSTLKSLFTAENTSKVIESWLIQSIQQSVEKQADIDASHLVEDCHKHWETVRPRVKKRLSIDLDDFDDERDGFDTIHEEFTDRMGAAARRAVQNLRIRKALNPQIVKRREYLKNWLYVSLIFTMLAGVTGALNWGGEYYAAAVLLSLASLVLAGFAIQVRWSGRKITKALGVRLASARAPFSRALEQDYQEGVRRFYIEYNHLLSSVRRHIFDAQQELAPNREQRNRLFLELMIIEREF